MAHETDAGFEVVWWIESVWFRGDDEIVRFFEVTVCVERLSQSFGKSRTLTWIITDDAFLWRR